MKQTRKQCRFPALFSALVLFFAVLLSVSAAADPVQTFSLTAISRTEETVVTDVDFKLYLVADPNEDGTYSFESPFSRSGADLRSLSTEENWTSLAVTLESYIVQCAATDTPIAYTASAPSNENGTVTFTGLESGLYLLVGSQTVIGDSVYTPLATLVSLSTDTDSASSFEQTVYVKYSVEPNTSSTELSVLKVWEDDGSEYARPASVSVVLYRDGIKYDSVILSKYNNWMHTWKVPNDTARWQVVEEEIPTSYTVTYQQEGTVFIVTNTYTEPSTPDSPSPDLPLTGQLWWPVSLLVLVGLVLFFLGIRLHKKS